MHKKTDQTDKKIFQVTGMINSRLKNLRLRACYVNLTMKLKFYEKSVVNDQKLISESVYDPPRD